MQIIIFFYKFYEKLTKLRLVISKESAMPMRKKMDTLSQEVFNISTIPNTKLSGK